MVLTVRMRNDATCERVSNLASLVTDMAMKVKLLLQNTDGSVFAFLWSGVFLVGDDWSKFTEIEVSFGDGKNIAFADIPIPITRRKAMNDKGFL